MRACFRYAASVILRVTYGKTTPTAYGDPELVRVRQMLANFQIALRPGAYLVDRIPWLKHVPGYGRQLKEFHQYELALFRDQLNRVRDNMVRPKLRTQGNSIVADTRMAVDSEQRWAIVWKDAP